MPRESQQRNASLRQEPGSDSVASRRGFPGVRCRLAHSRRRLMNFRYRGHLRVGLGPKRRFTFPVSRRSTALAPVSQAGSAGPPSEPLQVFGEGTRGKPKKFELFIWQGQRRWIKVANGPQHPASCAHDRGRTVGVDDALVRIPPWSCSSTAELFVRDWQKVSS